MNANNCDFYIYVLDHLDNQECYYVGLTQDIDKRILKHQKGQVISTKKYGDPKKLRCFHIWTSQDYVSASKLERYCHEQQKKQGKKWILKFLTENPIYENNLKNQIDILMPITDFEKHKK